MGLIADNIWSGVGGAAGTLAAFVGGCYGLYYIGKAVANWLSRRSLDTPPPLPPPGFGIGPDFHRQFLPEINRLIDDKERELSASEIRLSVEISVTWHDWPPGLPAGEGPPLLPGPVGPKVEPEACPPPRPTDTPAQVEADVSDGQGASAEPECRLSLRRAVHREVYKLLCTTAEEYDVVRAGMAKDTRGLIWPLVSAAGLVVAEQAHSVGVAIGATTVAVAILRSLQALILMGRNAWCAWTFQHNPSWSPPANRPSWERQKALTEGT